MSGSGTYSEVDPNGYYEGWTSTSPISMVQWLIIPMIFKTTGLVLVKIGTGFEVSWRRLAALISWWLSWFITTNGVELVHIYFKNWWEEVWATDDAFISLVSNSSTAFANIILSNAESCSNWLESFCIIVGGRWRTKMMRSLTWSGQGIWGYNNFYILIESTNIPSCADSQFSVVVNERDKTCHIGRNECLEFIDLWKWLHVLEEKSCGRDSFSREVNLLLESENSATEIFKLFSVIEYQGCWVRLNTTIHPLQYEGARALRSLDKIFHPKI